MTMSPFVSVWFFGFPLSSRSSNVNIVATELRDDLFMGLLEQDSFCVAELTEGKLVVANPVLRDVVTGSRYHRVVIVFGPASTPSKGPADSLVFYTFIL